MEAVQAINQRLKKAQVKKASAKATKAKAGVGLTGDGGLTITCIIKMSLSYMCH